VGDSFSSAHAERADGGTGAVRWLRTWNMVPLFQRSDERLRHGFDDARDQRFLDVRDPALAEDPACQPDTEHPYTFKRECLSAEARAAVEGLRELLVVTWRVRNRMAGVCLDAGATTRGGVVTGLTFLADIGTRRTPWLWALGGRVFADGRGPRERGRTRHGLSPELRLYPVRFLGVVLDPAEGTWAPAAARGTPAFALGGRAGLALRWEVLQAVVRAPPFSYSRRVWERSAGLELALGLDFAPLLEID
jgi:hypothetical protein